MLFQPFTDGHPDWGLFLPVALVAGYFVSTILGIVLDTRSVVRSLETCYIKDLPGSSGVTRQQILKRADWWSNIWDFDTLFYSLSKDDREYA